MPHNENMEKSRIVIVVGMHRGGTSAVARTLASLGVDLGDNLIPPGDDNPRGFWEDRDCWAINEELLQHLGSAYDRLAPAWRFVQPDPAVSALKIKAAQLLIRKTAQYGPVFGFKDPRTSRLLPFWRQVIQSCDLNPSYVIALRNPLSVALSLQKRNQISAEKSYFLWLQHMLPAVLDTVGSPRVIVDYDLLINQPAEQLRRIADALGLNIEKRPTADASGHDDYLDPELRHTQFAISNVRLDCRVPDDVAQAYEILARTAKDEIGLDETDVLVHLAAMDSRLRAYSAVFRHVNDLENDKIVLYTTLGERDARVLALGQAALEAELQSSHLKREISDEAAKIDALNHGALESRAQIASLSRTLSEQADQIASLNQTLAEREATQVNLRQSLADRETQIEGLSQTIAKQETYVRAVDEKIAGQAGTIAGYGQEIVALQTVNAELKASMSWRITAPLRYLFGLLLKVSRNGRGPSQAAAVIQPGDSPESQNAPLLAERPSPPPDWTQDYVQDTPPAAELSSDVRVIAFYLPQFHPIPENDQAWGKGFTEWINVSRARPQFHGHYQPHLPAELGFYDLRVRDVQTQQVALARRYGIGAFCFYFYWFGGKVLLDLPLRQYLDNPDLDLPFCLCWANENWTRRWDGVDDQVIIAQQHSADDDIAFIEHVARYMRDPRYLSVNNRPVLLVYQPSLLPNALETVGRWRRWAAENGLGDLYLICTQSLDARDPADYGFDAATEFPPNLTGPPIVTDTVQPYDPAFPGVVYDMSALVERSRSYSAPSYKLLRGVCPSWDNTPRRGASGAVFLNSSPEGYREWLENAIKDTQQRLRKDERLVFVNAWNEWAEGAHLEPDRRYGYAWLQATRQALVNAGAQQSASPARVVVVTHDAYQHGAQLIALNLARELVETLACKIEVVCLGDGPLKAEFARYGKVHDLAGVDTNGPRAREVAADLFERGFNCALVNTTVGGHFLVTLKQAGLRCVALVHELRELILSHKVETHARALAEHADSVVFPTPEIRDAFLEFGDLKPERVVIRPQGVLKRNCYRGSDPFWMRQALRQQLGLPEDASIVIGVGYGDRRKGIDHFVEIATRLRDRAPLIHLVWVGRLEVSCEAEIRELAINDPGLFRQIHFVGHQEDPAFYYAGADLLALTSREDPFPNVVLEAMGSGLPVVAFAGSGGANRLIDEGGGSNVAMGDCEAFADAILKIIQDRPQYEAMAQRGRDLIAERFSWRQYAFDLLGLAGLSLRKVSVVVPNYNYERYLTARLSTILSQTYPIYELIFLDDASKDNSLALAERILAQSSVDYRIIANESNSGSVFRQWKLGAEQARGDIVWIAEADDLSEPEFLATVLRGFDHPDVVLSYCESKQIDQDDRVLGVSYQDYVKDLSAERWQKGYVNEGEQEIRNYLAVKNTIPNASAVLSRRDALVRALKEQVDICSYKVAGDWKVYVHLLARGRLAFVAQSLNLHRRHQMGVTMNGFNESQYREIQALQNFVASRYEISEDVALLAQNYLSAVRQHFGLDLDVKLEPRSAIA